MPVALDISAHAIALYTHLLYHDALGKPAFGLRTDIPRSQLYGMDLYAQDAWRELVDAGLAVESPDPWGRYSAYSYVAPSYRVA